MSETGEFYKDIKTPEQIHAWVGVPLTVGHAEKMSKAGWRAYQVSDIAKI